MRSTIQYLMKVTRQCNLRCTYCNDWRSQSTRMNLVTVGRVLDSAALEPGLRRAAFIWHGGEPTLVPIKFYEDVLEAQRRLSARGITCDNAIQTNGLRLNAEWIHFLSTSGFGVGVSIDGPPEVQDASRPKIGGRASSPDVLSAMHRLHDAGIRFGITMVVSEALMALGPSETWKFIRGQPADTINLLPMREPLSSEAETIAPEANDLGRYTDFMGTLFDYWFDSDRSVDILFFRSILAKLAARPSDTCVLAGRCFGMIFGIEPDGQVTHCPLFGAIPDFTIGNIYEADIMTMRGGPNFQRAVKQNERRLEAASPCRSFDICAGGCPHYSYQTADTNVLFAGAGCCGYDRLIQHIRTRLEEQRRPDLLLADV